MEATIVYWGYIAIMEKKMEATIWGLGRALAECLHQLTDDVPSALAFLASARPVAEMVMEYLPRWEVVCPLPANSLGHNAPFPLWEWGKVQPGNLPS